MGWEMGLKYVNEEYIWCLTYEQPLDAGKKRGDEEVQTNRKFRILMARKGLVELAEKFDAHQVFREKFGQKDGGYTKYCDRRWHHLKILGQIVTAKAQARSNNNKEAQAWLDTFFVDTLSVVAPVNVSDKRKRRAWEDYEDEKWKPLSTEDPDRERPATLKSNSSSLRQLSTEMCEHVANMDD